MAPVNLKWLRREEEKPRTQRRAEVSRFNPENDTVPSFVFNRFFLYVWPDLAHWSNQLKTVLSVVNRS